MVRGSRRHINFPLPSSSSEAEWVGGGHCQLGAGAGATGPRCPVTLTAAAAASAFSSQCPCPIVFLCSMDLSVLALSVVGWNAKMLVGVPESRVFCRAERRVRSGRGQFRLMGSCMHECDAIIRKCTRAKTMEGGVGRRFVTAPYRLMPGARLLSYRPSVVLEP